MKTTNDRIYLNALLAALLVQDCIENLATTPYYRHELKKSAKAFTRELDKVIRADVPKVWGEDDEIMYALMDHQQEHIMQLSRMKPEDMSIMCGMMKAYQQDPLQVITFLETRFADL